MMNLYDLEHLCELRMAERERQAAQAALLREAAAVQGPPFREQVANWLIALAARLAPTARDAVGTSRARVGPPPL